MTKFYKYILALIMIPVATLTFAQVDDEPFPIDTTGTQFHDDFESGMGAWTTVVYGTDDLWHISGLNFTSPSYSMWCGIESQGNYATNRRINTSVVSPTIDLTKAIAPITLSFNEIYNTEGGWDYCMVDVSVDGGINWNPLRGTVGSAPSGNSGGWQYRELDLSGYIGGNIQIRLYFDTRDGLYNNSSGWFVDDIKVTGVFNGNITDNPNLALLHMGDTIPADSTIDKYWSTIEPTVYETVIANYSRDTLIIDTVFSSSGNIVFSQPAANTLLPATGVSLHIEYMPIVTGTVVDTLYIVSNDADQDTFKLIFNGEAFAAPRNPEPILIYEGEVKTSDNFANPQVMLDTILERGSGYSDYFTFQITNRGTETLNMFNISTSDGGNSYFWLESYSGSSLRIGDTATVVIGYYAGDTERSQIAALYFTYHNLVGEVIQFQNWMTAQDMYEGTYLAYDGPWSSSGDSLYINFSHTPVGDSEFFGDFYFRNMGEVAMNINIIVEGSDFDYVGETNFTLLPGQTNYESSFEGIRFAPSSDTPQEGMLIIEHNDTSASNILDTIYLFGDGYVEQINPNPKAELSLVIDNQVINNDTVSMRNFGAIVENSGFSEKWFTIVNSSDIKGYIDLNNITNSFYWIYNNSIYSSYNNLEIPANDSVKIVIRFNPGSGYIYENKPMVYFESNGRTILFDCLGYGLERHDFLVRYYGNNDVSEYENVLLPIYDGWEDTTEFVYTNLHESPITLDSIALVTENNMNRISAPGLPRTVAPGESYSFNTLFDPLWANDSVYKATVKIYSSNMIEPVWVFYLNNGAFGDASYSISLLSEGLYFNGHDFLDFNSVSAIDGSRTADFRAYSTNGYNLIIDSLRIHTDDSRFSFSGISDNTVVGSEDSTDFSITVNAVDTVGNISDELFFYTQNTNIISLNAEAIADFQDEAKLVVKIDNRVVENGGYLHFGDSRQADGIENIVVALNNNGVQYIQIDSILFSNSSFSMLEENGNMFEDFEIWYDHSEKLLLYFNPDDIGLIEGTMTIYSNDPNNPEYVINLAGNGTTDLSEAEQLSNASIYPNPATNTVYLNTGLELETQVYIFNTSGETVFSGYATNGQAIDISVFNKGVYVVQLMNEDSSSTIKLLVE